MTVASTVGALHESFLTSHLWHLETTIQDDPCNMRFLLIYLYYLLGACKYVSKLPYSLSGQITFIPKPESFGHVGGVP